MILCEGTLEELLATLTFFTVLFSFSFSWQLSSEVLVSVPARLGRPRFFLLPIEGLAISAILSDLSLQGDVFRRACERPRRRWGTACSSSSSSSTGSCVSLVVIRGDCACGKGDTDGDLFTGEGGNVVGNVVSSGMSGVGDNTGFSPSDWILGTLLSLFTSSKRASNALSSSEVSNFFSGGGASVGRCSLTEISVMGSISEGALTSTTTGQAGFASTDSTGFDIRSGSTGISRRLGMSSLSGTLGN